VRRKEDVGFTPKSHESRTIPLPDSLIALLRARRKKAPHERWLGGPTKVPLHIATTQEFDTGSAVANRAHTGNRRPQPIHGIPPLWRQRQSRGRVRLRLSKCLHQWLLTLRTAPVEWLHLNASLGGAGARAAKRREMALYTHTTLGVIGMEA
jgi:hypothetical protein